MARLRGTVLALSVSAGLVSPAAAQSPWISEVKVGVGLHDAGVFGSRKESGAAVNGEVLFQSPAFLRPIWAPRPHLGVETSTAGDTSQIYGGLTWQYDFEIGLFVAGSLGAAVHDGKLDTPRGDRKSLGTRTLFRESAEVGYRFGDNRRHSVSVMLSHISNAWLGNPNEGMDTVALRYGVRF
jgi:lipid A 3-O-deacylase